MCARRFFAAGGCRRRSIRSSSRPLVVLGIETSCDDTGVAVVTSSGDILGECIASQAGIHEVWGGVKPDAAMAAHKGAIEKTVETALERASEAWAEKHKDSADESLKKFDFARDITGISVTTGPGLSRSN